MKSLSQIFFLILIQMTANLFAWSNHSLCTYVVTKEMPELQKADLVEVETLEAFLAKEKEGLAEILNQEEEYMKKNIPFYPTLPDEINFAKSKEIDIVKSFLYAIRVNPKSKLGYYLQVIPGNTPRLPLLESRKVTLLTKDDWIMRYTFTELKKGDKVSPIEVISTAADEPDYGLDLELYSDNESEFGKKYGFGEQPFGNPEIEYATQAPIHIGYYHEAWIVFLFADYLKRTLPEYRMREFLALSRFAFKTGHPYWGYRFLGWGLHYIEDLTQPYHASVLPGTSVMEMIWINTLDVFGFDSLKKAAIQRISVRHEAIENYHYAILLDSLKNHTTHTFMDSMQDTKKDSIYGEYNQSYVRNLIAKESKERSDRLDFLLGNTNEILAFQRDAKFDLTTIPDNEATRELNSLIEEMMLSLGSHARNYIRAGLN